jgi:hypothetical protein
MIVVYALMFALVVFVLGVCIGDFFIYEFHTFRTSWLEKREQQQSTQTRKAVA